MAPYCGLPSMVCTTTTSRLLLMSSFQENLEFAASTRSRNSSDDNRNSKNCKDQVKSLPLPHTSIKYSTDWTPFVSPNKHCKSIIMWNKHSSTFLFHWTKNWTWNEKGYKFSSPESCFTAVGNDRCKNMWHSSAVKLIPRRSTGHLVVINWQSSFSGVPFSHAVNRLSSHVHMFSVWPKITINIIKRDRRSGSFASD